MRSIVHQLMTTKSIVKCKKKKNGRRRGRPRRKSLAAGAGREIIIVDFDNETDKKHPMLDMSLKRSVSEENICHTVLSSASQETKENNPDERGTKQHLLNLLLEREQNSFLIFLTWQLQIISRS